MELVWTENPTCRCRMLDMDFHFEITKEGDHDYTLIIINDREVIRFQYLRSIADAKTMVNDVCEKCKDKPLGIAIYEMMVKQQEQHEHEK